MPNATVRVTNVTTGVTRAATTSADGVYRVPSLGAGVYTVEVEKAGFLKAQRQNLKVGISETVRLDFTLEVSGVAETVTVESRAPLVETQQGRGSGRGGSPAGGLATINPTGFPRIEEARHG